MKLKDLARVITDVKSFIQKTKAVEFTLFFSNFELNLLDAILLNSILLRVNMLVQRIELTKDELVDLVLHKKNITVTRFHGMIICNIGANAFSIDINQSDQSIVLKPEHLIYLQEIDVTV